MAGRIDYYFLPIAPALALIKDGKVAALAVSSDKRAPSLPDVPTIAEVGLPKAAYAFWNGVFVPVKTPRDIVNRLHDETQKAIATPSVKERLAKLGIEPLVMSQPEFEQYFKADVLDTDEARQGSRHREAVTRAPWCIWESRHDEPTRSPHTRRAARRRSWETEHVQRIAPE